MLFKRYSDRKGVHSGKWGSLVLSAPARSFHLLKVFFTGRGLLVARGDPSLSLGGSGSKHLSTLPARSSKARREEAEWSSHGAEVYQKAEGGNSGSGAGWGHWGLMPRGGLWGALAGSQVHQGRPFNPLARDLLPYLKDLLPQIFVSDYDRPAFT